jgi:hypothetical protein
MGQLFFRYKILFIAQKKFSSQKTPVHLWSTSIRKNKKYGWGGVFQKLIGKSGLPRGKKVSHGKTFFTQQPYFLLFMIEVDPK